MLNIKFTLEHPIVPEFDPEIHDPDEVFALLCSDCEEFITPSGVTSRYFFNNTQGVDKPPFLCQYINVPDQHMGVTE